MFKSLVVTDSLVSFSVPQFLPRTPIRNTVQFETLLHALEDTKNAAIIMLVPMTDAKEYANMDPELMQEVFGAVPTYMAIALYVESNQTRLDVVFTDEKYAIIDMTDFTDEIKRTITQLQSRFQGTGVDLPNIQVHTLSNKRLQITVDASLHGIVSDVLSVYTAAYLE